MPSCRQHHLLHAFFEVDRDAAQGSFCPCMLFNDYNKLTCH